MLSGGEGGSLSGNVLKLFPLDGVATLGGRIERARAESREPTERELSGSGCGPLNLCLAALPFIRCTAVLPICPLR